MKIQSKSGVNVPIEHSEHLKNVVNTPHSCTYVLGSTPLESTHDAYVVFDKTDNENHFFYLKNDDVYSPDPDIAPLKMTVDEYREFNNILHHDGRKAFDFVKTLHDVRVPVVTIKLFTGKPVTVNRSIVELYVKTCSKTLVTKHNFDDVVATMQDHVSTLMVMTMDAECNDVVIRATSYDNLMRIITDGISNAIDDLQQQLDD